MKKQKFKKTVKKYKVTILVASVPFIFPLVVGAVYALPLPQIIMVEAGDLLSFYGVAFGIMGSYITYANNKKKEEASKNEKLKPKLRVELEMDDVGEEIFKLTVYNDTRNILHTIFLYDCFAKMNLNHKEVFYVAFKGAREEYHKNQRLFNIDMGEGYLEEDGYPKFVQICCDDEEKRMWDCTFDLRGRKNERFYYPRNFEII